MDNKNIYTLTVTEPYHKVYTCDTSGNFFKGMFSFIKMMWVYAKDRLEYDKTHGS